MTMPHLMNCSHSGEGWCLDCVKELYDRLEKAESKCLVSVPLDHKFTKGDRETYLVQWKQDYADDGKTLWGFWEPWVEAGETFHEYIVAAWSFEKQIKIKQGE